MCFLFVFQGKSLVTGTLDVMETIGKKTYDVLAEGDHGLKHTIRNTTSKPNLSQVHKQMFTKHVPNIGRKCLPNVWLWENVYQMYGWHLIAKYLG